MNRQWKTVKEKDGQKKKKAVKPIGGEWWALCYIFLYATLGFGFGILAHLYRDQLQRAFGRYIILTDPGQMLLAALLFFGVIMGFFVVRNWSKEQKDFVSSLTAVFGGVFVASLLGQVKGVELLPALAHYAFGFAVSGGLNLYYYNKLVREYSTTRSLAARAAMDNLYGTDKAKVIDAYFQKSFEEDPNYARRLLVETLRQYRNEVLTEFARMIEFRRERAAHVTSPPTPRTFYWLMYIDCEGAEGGTGAPPVTSPPLLSPPADGGAADDMTKLYKVKFREVGKSERDRIGCEMFRMGVTIRSGDSLVYILAPGEYHKPFPLQDSVAGLALYSRQTIVMNRDDYKTFRYEGYDEGRFPHGLKHRRGRGKEEVDYLSYVSVPVVSRLGNPEETSLGIINVDTKLFVARPDEVEKLPGHEAPGKDGVITVWMTLKDLDEWATRLYDQDDEAVRFLERMSSVTVPILELYLKCQQAAS